MTRFCSPLLGLDKAHNIHLLSIFIPLIKAQQAVRQGTPFIPTCLFHTGSESFLKDNTLPLHKSSSQQLPSQHILVLITQKYLPWRDLLHIAQQLHTNLQSFLSPPEDKRDKSPWLLKHLPSKNYSPKSRPSEAKSMPSWQQSTLRQLPQSQQLLLFLQQRQTR